jgi:hypothetical protein
MIIATHAIIIILQTITRHVSYMPRPNMQIFNYTYGYCVKNYFPYRKAHLEYRRQRVLSRNKAYTKAWADRC